MTWVRLDGQMSRKAENSSFGQELYFREVEFTDAGRYQCQGSNSESTRMVTRDFQLSVECMYTLS